MEAKYTKGEWKVANHGVSRLHIAVNPENPIETTSICSLYGSGREEEIQANAKLISAAPDMFNILEKLIRANKNLAKYNPDTFISPEVWREAESILKKATE
jgi:hypothetical protein